MNRDQRPVPVKPEDPGALLVWFQDVIRQARLAWLLLWDRRVPWWTKLIPPFVLAYVLSPVDLIPDVMVGLGQLDDIAVLLLGAKLFIELAPPDIVREHLLALGARIKEWRVVDGEGQPPTVLEGEYTLKGPETPDTESKPADQ